MPNGFIPIPDWFSFENQGAGIAIADLGNTGEQDLVVLMVDSPPGQNRGVYRVGKALDADGTVTGGWTPWIDVPDWFSFENQGGGIAVAELGDTGEQDLVVLMVDNPPGQNRGVYRVGKALDADGTVTGGWTPWIDVPDWFSFENQGGGIAVSSVGGQPALVIFVVDNGPEQNRGIYRIGSNLDADGNVTGGWTPWIDVPDWFWWENQGGGIAAADLANDGGVDLITFAIDNPIVQNLQNQGFYRTARSIGADGTPGGGWSKWFGVPHWFSWENGGGDIAHVRIGGRNKLAVMMIDTPPGQNAGFYKLIDLDEDPAVHGQWQVLPFHSGVLAVHAALLTQGQVMFFSGSGSSDVRFNAPTFGNVAAGVPLSAIWDPAGPNGGEDLFFPDTLRFGPERGNQVYDFFCGGHAFLPDGRMLNAGGTLGYNNFKGLKECAVFDHVSRQWSFVAPMDHGRWYPTLITLGDGRILAVSGLNEAGDGHSQALEIYSADTDTWEERHFDVGGGFPGLPLYAHLFLMADGRIFFSGGRMDDPLNVQPCIFDLSHDPVPTAAVHDLLDPILRNQSASVILPPAQDQRVMICGGGPLGPEDKTHAVDTVSIVDLNNPDPEYLPAGRMALPRMHLNAVLLPDHTVFVSGGSLQQEDQPLARLQAEVYDPATDRWRLLAAAGVERLYHSTALLLPDGRVIAAGGNPHGGSQDVFEPPDPDEEMRLEVFSPPYLFRGPRPTITGAPTVWTYGQTVAIASPQAGGIRWASLIKNGATTHSFDSCQRLIDLDIQSQGGGTVQAVVTDNPNIAPPGWYMLFLIDTQGIPSVARWIQLQGG
jgi:hypothetical protein